VYTNNIDENVFAEIDTGNLNPEDQHHNQAMNNIMRRRSGC
jgi:hypothetical protein